MPKRTRDFCESKVVLHFMKTLKEHGISFDAFLQDAKALHTFLTPTTTIQKNGAGEVSEKEVADPKTFLLQYPPNAIMIFGSNDLKPVEYVVWQLNDLKAAGIDTAKIPIFI